MGAGVYNDPHAIRQAFAMLDENDDDVLDQDEVCIGGGGTRGGVGVNNDPHAIRQTFAMLDENDDDVLDQDEVSSRKGVRVRDVGGGGVRGK